MSRTLVRDWRNAVDSSDPILDFNLSDTMEDMLYLGESAKVIGGVIEFTSLMNDLPSLYWESNSNDGDIGDCINPNSVHTIAPVSQSPTSPEAQSNLSTHSKKSPPPSLTEKKKHLTSSVQNTKSHISTQNILSSNSLSHQKGVTKKMKPKMTGRIYPKPPCSYSCLIALALKNCRANKLPVAEIYTFICEHFPYYRTATNGWKNSIRHNLSVSKYFKKVEGSNVRGGRKNSCVWAMRRSKKSKMNKELKNWSRKDPNSIRKAMMYPDKLKSLRKGLMKHGSTGHSKGENKVGDEYNETNTNSEQNGTELDDNIQNTTESESRDEDDMPQIDYDIEVADLYDAMDLNDADEEDCLSFEDLHPSIPRLDMNLVNWFSTN